MRADHAYAKATRILMRLEGKVEMSKIFNVANKTFENVKIGRDAVIEDFVILGKPPKGKQPGELELSIGEYSRLGTGAIIYSGSRIDDCFQTGEYSIIFPYVKIGKNVKIGEYTIIGVPPKGKGSNELVTIIGNGSTIRSHTVIYAGTKIGKNFNCGHGAKIREFTIIGDNSQVGMLSQIEGYAKIGNNVKLHTNVHVGQYSEIGDYVFIAPGTVLTNTLHPLCPKVEKCIKGPAIRSYVKIGTNVTVAPRVEIGENSLIGAGANVVRDVPKDSVVVGNPGKIIKSIHDLDCPFNLIDKPYSLENRNITA